MKGNYQHIFTPLTVKNMTIKNRITMMPMGTNYGEQNGEMSFLHINYYEQRAKGGTGLIIVENASVDSPQGSNGTTQLRIDHDNYLPRLFKFCENIHRYGTCIAIQINHAGASAVSSRINMQPVSASDIPTKDGGDIPRPLTKEEILDIVKKYEYISRVFYMPDYAKELRMSRVDRLLTEEFDGCISKMDAVYKKLQFRLTALETGEQICNVFLTNMLLIFVLVYKIFIVGSVSIGDLSVSIAAVGKLNSMYSGLLESLSQFVQSGMFADKLRTFLDIEQTVASPENPSSLPIVPGDIEFRDVSFRYGDGGWVLRHINMKIKAQTKAAVVGYNGAGKSTLVKLLMRFYDPTEGEILLNGKNIKEYDLDEYRHSFGTLFQDFQIYAASLGENVKMGLVESRDEAMIKKALMTAGVADNLRDLSVPLLREYDKNGRLVSGGEAQKIAIARAFLKNPHTYILDEPSSALDPISEYNLNRTLFELSKDKTVIFISHRLSTTRMAEQIYMMEQGRVIEEGNHEELLARGGRYAEMFEKQAEKYRET